MTFGVRVVRTHPARCRRTNCASSPVINPVATERCREVCASSTRLDQVTTWQAADRYRNNEGPAVAREALAQLAIFYVSVVTGATDSTLVGGPAASENVVFSAEVLLHPFGGALAHFPAGAQTQLMFDVFPVALDRFHAQIQRRRDLPGAKPRAEQLENVHLAVG